MSVEGTPLGEAIVNGYWSGSFDQAVSDTTANEGTIEFVSRWVKQAGTFTFTVTSVEKNGVTYVLAGETVFNI